MFLNLLVVGLLAAANAEKATFVFELAGIPVGTVELTLEPSGQYVYRSRQLFTRGDDRSQLVRTAELRVDAQAHVEGSSAFPESLWLWRRPAKGCVPGREEIGGREGKLCALELEKDTVRGSVFSQPFEGKYDPSHRLLELSIGHARFTRAPVGTELAPPPDVFSSGFPITGSSGPLQLQPSVDPEQRATLAPISEANARALAQQVHDSFSHSRPTVADLVPEEEIEARAGSCVAHARRFVRWAKTKRGRPQAMTVYGLVADGDRAFAHAWVRVRLPNGEKLDLDPTLLIPVDPRTHLPLGKAFGRVVLDLLAGRAHVSRR